MGDVYDQHLDIIWEDINGLLTKLREMHQQKEETERIIIKVTKAKEDAVTEIEKYFDNTK